jgi:hypothetical protein
MTVIKTPVFTANHRSKMWLHEPIGACCGIHILPSEVDRPAAADRTVSLHDYNLLVFPHRLRDFVWHDQGAALEIDVF